MNTSLLHRLPDIVALARARARDLIAPPSGPLPGRRLQRPAQPPGAVDPLARRVTLLCGDELPVMLGLLLGRGRDGPLAGRVPLIWLEPAAPRAPANDDAVVTPLQQKTRALLDFAVRLFVARELLTRDGLLATPVPFDGERCVERLLIAVFGQARPLVAPVQPLNGAPQSGVCLAGRSLPPHLPPMSGPDLLFDLALHATRRDDSVVVLPASPASAGWVAALDRQWVLVQPDAMAFALLKEHVIARQMRLPGAAPARESAREWASAF